MSIEQTFHCDGPDCERRVSGAAHREPGGRFLTVTGWAKALHFCGWDCVLKYAATKEPEQIIYPDRPDA
jgi:hypothetical protein